MQLCKFFKVMGVVIVLALTYIHMQMQIVDLAYKGNKKEHQIKKLTEKNGNTMYKILMLKSANHLGIAMLEEDSDMQFADSDDVVQIAASKEFLMENQLGEQSKLAKRTNPLLSLLSFGIEAEAKTVE
jgi:cell division protein FtsL